MKHTASDETALEASEPAPSDPSVTFDLKAEAAKLQNSPVWTERGLASRTLLKHPDLRLVLIALRSGEQIKPHKNGTTGQYPGV